MSGSTPASGEISFNDLQSVFSGTNPIDFNEYYKNASTGYTADVSGIPNIGTTISLDNFYSKSKTAAPAVAVTFNTASVYNASQMGVVNGITALKNLTIKGFDIAVVGAPVGDTINVSIYWRNGSVTDTGILTNSSVWTLAGSTNLSAVGYLQEIPITTTIIVAANANITFLIIITTPSRYLSYSNGTQLNGTFASNSDMTVKSGYGINSFPNPSIRVEPRNFNGNIRYTIP